MDVTGSLRIFQDVAQRDLPTLILIPLADLYF